MNLGFLWTALLVTWTLQGTQRAYAYVLNYPLIGVKQGSYGLTYTTQRRCGGRGSGEGVKSGSLETAAWGRGMRVKDSRLLNRAVGVLCDDGRRRSGGNLVAMTMSCWGGRDGCKGRRKVGLRPLGLHWRKGVGFFHRSGSTPSSIRDLHGAGGKFSKGKQLIMMSSSSLGGSGDAWRQRRRVVATGVGVVSGCGENTVESFWNFILEGKSSINKISHNFLPDDGYRCKVGSEVVNFDPKHYFRVKKSIKTNDRATHFAVAASRMALHDAGTRMNIASLIFCELNSNPT